MFRNLKVVPRVVFGRGSFNQLDEILAAPRKNADGGRVVFMIDEYFTGKELAERIPARDGDEILFIHTGVEPKTGYIDELRDRIAALPGKPPAAVVGIGGGTVMDISKAVAVMLNNPGSSVEYQGWDLVKHPSVYSIGVPTLTGTGAEVSRTAVLTGPTRKLGINSDYTVYDQIVLDADLLKTVPRDQAFYTAMDCYVHGAEALNGTFINTFARAYGEKSMDMCREVYLGECADPEETMMMASYFGGLSIAYSQVGVCHALSYGLSFLLGVRHGIGNCIVFNHLQDYYPKQVAEFHRMLERNSITLPTGITSELSDADMERMIDVALGLEPLWQNALGPDWRKHMTRDRARELYRLM